MYATVDQYSLSSGEAFSHRNARGNRQVFKERFVRETATVQKFLAWNAARLTDQRADAEDLVQETLMKAYVSFDSYREGTHLKSWLARIMANTWVDNHRRTQRRPPEMLGDEVTDTPASARASAGDRSVASAEAVVLDHLPGEAALALQALPDELREIVYYACVADYRYAEIAAVLDIPIGTVASRLHRGKTLLRERLSDSV
jgi:RNA polymerase sigma-70 factor (ECF subfamily)